MLDESELDDIDEVSIDEAYYDDITGELAYRWRDPLRPTGIGDDTDTWY
jgi:hypothetical protein